MAVNWRSAMIVITDFQRLIKSSQMNNANNDFI